MATALFSLEVGVDAVACATPEEGELVLAFQLLQLDIVVIEDAQLVPGEVPGQRRLDHAPVGRMCLFENDWARLAEEIQADPTAPLVLLVLQRQQEQAKLIAFACVGFSVPHVALGNEGKKPRVNEWVSIESTWPLMNHQHQSLGSITGSVTLSCLGNTGAREAIVRRLTTDVEWTKRSVEDPSETERAVAPPPGASETPPIPAKDEGEISRLEEVPVASLGSPPKVIQQEQKKDAAVQYDHEDEEEGVRRQGLIPIRIRRSQYDPHKASSSRQRIVDEMDRIQTTSRSRLRKSSTDRKTARHRDDYLPEYFQPDLPPPLYFQKPKHEKIQK